MRKQPYNQTEPLSPSYLQEHCGGVSCFSISNHPSSNVQGAPEILYAYSSITYQLQDSMWSICFLFTLASFYEILIRIRGVTGVELLSGVHWYLKNLCGAHISWDKTGGSQLSSVPKPGSLPRMQDDGLLIQRPVPWNYYQNAVTSSCKLFIYYIPLKFIKYI